MKREQSEECHDHDRLCVKFQFKLFIILVSFPFRWGAALLIDNKAVKGCARLKEADQTRFLLHSVHSAQQQLINALIG